MPDIKMITRRKAGRVPVLDRPDADFDIDLICDMISTGESLTSIAKQIGIHAANLIRWIENDSQRSARAKEARIRSARIWDEKAEAVIAAAPDKFELDRARELAHHYRWRAKAIAPRDYGDKVTQEHTGAGGGPIAIAAVDLRNLTDAELENMNLLMSKASGST
jgi:transposase-like protein